VVVTGGEKPHKGKALSRERKLLLRASKTLECSLASESTAGQLVGERLVG
jgi:hypothetical protein